jgi:hypothetical protein
VRHDGGWKPFVGSGVIGGGGCCKWILSSQGSTHRKVVRGGLRYSIIGAPEGMQDAFADNRCVCTVFFGGGGTC